MKHCAYKINTTYMSNSVKKEQTSKLGLLNYVKYICRTEKEVSREKGSMRTTTKKGIEW